MRASLVEIVAALRGLDTELGPGGDINPKALVATALESIDERIRALETCPKLITLLTRHPHVWDPIKADGSQLEEGERWSLVVGYRCRNCEVPRGNAP